MGPGPIAVDQDDVYWADEVYGTVSRVPLAGGSVVQVVNNPQAYPMSLALDSSHVY
jgi:hypothetical protein